MADATFLINGHEYPVPEIDTFNMDEAMVLYQYSNLTLDLVAELEGLHPGVVAALMHVALARGNPGMRAKEIKEVVKAANLLEVLAAIEVAMEGADAADPPEIPSPPLEQPNDSDEKAGSSGDGSVSDGDDHQETNLRAIGTQL